MPIRRSAGAVDGELTRYLSEIGRRCELIVVDGSDPAEFDDAHVAWSGLGHHVRPHAAIAGRNGKVRGVLTGVALASHERVVIADDDVRYDAACARTDDRRRCATSSWFGRRTTSRRCVARALGHRAHAPQSGRGRCRLPRHARGAAQHAPPDRRVRRRRPVREPRAHPDDRGGRRSRAQPSRPLRPPPASVDAPLLVSATPSGLRRVRPPVASLPRISRLCRWPRGRSPDADGGRSVSRP